MYTIEKRRVFMDFKVNTSRLVYYCAAGIYDPYSALVRTLLFSETLEGRKREKRGLNRF